MDRIFEKVVARRLFDHLAKVHDRDIIGEVLDDGEVVRDENIRQAHVALELLEQVEYLRLNGHVQRRHRLVADDELGIDRKRAGDAYTLAAASVQLMGIDVDISFGKADGLHKLKRAPVDIGLGGEQLMLDYRLAYELADGLAGGKRGEGILEHHLHLLTQAAHFPAGIGSDILAVKDYPAGGRLYKLENAAARRRFAAAGLTDDAEGLALLDRKADAIDRVKLPGRRSKILCEVFHLKYRFTHQLFLLSLKFASSYAWHATLCAALPSAVLSSGTNCVQRSVA